MSDRLIDTVIFDVGGVLAANGRHSDFASRFPHADPEVVTRIFVGDYGEDGDHPWHRLERGEILLMSRRGETWHFEADDNAQWRRVPDSANPMILLRQ